MHVHDLPLDRRHRLERHAFAARERLRRRSVGLLLERRPPPVPVAGSVDEDALALLRTSEDDRGGQVLDRVDRLAALADHQTEVGAGQGRLEGLLVLVDVDPPRAPERRTDPVEELAKPSRGRVGVLRRPLGGRRDRSRARDHARRRIADSEQAALAFGKNRELDGRLVERGKTPFELSERGPLGLADGLTGGLYLGLAEFPLALAHLRVRGPFFFRRLTRCCGEPALGAGLLGPAPSPFPPPSSFGGVLDERLGGGWGLGMSRRVTRPWPTVQRFVVTQ